MNKLFLPVALLIFAGCTAPDSRIFHVTCYKLDEIVYEGNVQKPQDEGYWTARYDHYVDINTGKDFYMPDRGDTTCILEER